METNETGSVPTKFVETNEQDKRLTRWSFYLAVLSIVLHTVARADEGLYLAFVTGAFVVAVMAAVLSAAVLVGALVNCNVYHRYPGLWALSALLIMLGSFGLVLVSLGF